MFYAVPKNISYVNGVPVLLCVETGLSPEETLSIRKFEPDLSRKLLKEGCMFSQGHELMPSFTCFKVFQEFLPQVDEAVHVSDQRMPSSLLVSLRGPVQSTFMNTIVSVRTLNRSLHSSDRENACV